MVDQLRKHFENIYYNECNAKPSDKSMLCLEIKGVLKELTIKEAIKYFCKFPEKAPFWIATYQSIHSMKKTKKGK